MKTLNESYILYLKETRVVNVCYTRQNTIEIEKETRSAALESLTLH